MMTNMTVLTSDEILANHLQGHPAPYPLTLVDGCKIAIERVNQLDLFAMVDLPYNVDFNNWQTHTVDKSMEAFKFVGFFHLEKFLTKEGLDCYNKWMAS
jgi:hypothetical protein